MKNKKKRSWIMWAVIDHKRKYKHVILNKRQVMRIYERRKYALEWLGMKGIEVRKVKVTEL